MTQSLEEFISAHEKLKKSIKERDKTESPDSVGNYRIDAFEDHIKELNTELLFGLFEQIRIDLLKGVFKKYGKKHDGMKVMLMRARACQALLSRRNVKTKMIHVFGWGNRRR